MKVSELANTANVTPETIRHYTREGLIQANRNPENGYHQYDKDALRKVRFIQQARELGFSLKQVQDIFEQSDSGDSPCPLVRDLLKQKVPEVKQQIAQLQSHLNKMEAALSAWDQMQDGVPNGHSICCLIEEWDKPDDCCENGGKND